MAGQFDPYDKHSWYFGPISRTNANRVLMAETEIGVFLVRNSSTIEGDLVLCVREEEKVSHYIINKIVQQENNSHRFRIGEQVFPDVPALLIFYRAHYLDSTPLIRPINPDVVTQELETVIANFDFEPNDADDLAFHRDDLLVILNKDEDDWWSARNANGDFGSIPVNYVRVMSKNSSNGVIESTGNDESITTSPSNSESQVLRNSNCNNQSNNSTIENNSATSNVSVPQERKLPAMAKVIIARVPNAYDSSALRLSLGDLIKVTKTNVNGQWEGELNGKIGHFPFNCISFLDLEPSLELLELSSPNGHQSSPSTTNT